MALRCLLSFACFLFMLCLSISSAWAEIKTLQLLARTDLPQPVMQLAGPIRSGFENKVINVAVAGQSQPPLYMDIDSQRFEGVSADYLSLMQTLLDTTVKIHHYPTHSAALASVMRGEMHMLAIYVSSSSANTSTLIASEPWLLDYGVTGHKADLPLDMSRNLPERIAWSGDAMQRQPLEGLFPKAQLIRFPSDYEAVAATVFGQTQRVWGNAATLMHLNRNLFANALTLITDERREPMNISFGISPHFPALANAVNHALSLVPLSLRMQIANRWQLEARHVLQNNPLALSEDEEAWLKAHPVITTQLSDSLAPLSSEIARGTYRGMAIDVLNLIAGQTGLTYKPQDNSPSQAVLPRLSPLAMSETEDGANTPWVTRPWLVSHWVIVRQANPRPLLGRNPFPFGSAHILRNAKMKAWMTAHYPHLQLTESDEPLHALRDLEARRVDAVILPKIFADYFMRNHFGDSLKVESTLGAEPARFVMRVEPGNAPLLRILDKALLAIPPDTLFKLQAQWRQAESPSLRATWQNYKRAILLIIVVATGLIALILLWNRHLRRVIQQRIQAENALKNQFNFTQTLFNDSPVAMYIRDKQTRLVDCNNTYLRFLNVQREEVIGKRLTDVIPDDANIHSMEESYLLTLKSGEAVIRDLTIELHQESFQVYHWTLPFRDRLGEVAGVIGGWVDVTERNALLQELQMAKDAADKANRSKSDFLASMSHEIRTPLHAIIGLLELETCSQPAESLSENIRVAYSSAQALLSLIGDVLDMSKIESGLYQPTFETVYLPDVIEQAVALFRNQAESKGIALRVEMDIAAYWVKTDPLMINQILSNLLSNAIKFTEHGAVTVVLMQGIAQVEESCEFVIEVSDSGCGLTEEQQQAIFEPFVQVGEREQQQTGTGLGLSICCNLAHLLDGELIVESELNEGSVFSFYFRARQGEPQDQTRPHLSKPLNSDKLTVLVIDDHAPNRLLLGKQLELAGHQVVVSESAAEALALWQQAPLRFDLIITDCNMPGMNGFQFAAALRHYELQHNLRPITLFGLTASAEPHMMRRCLKAGMDDCMFKPLNMGRLVEKIAQAVPDRHPQPASDSTASEPLAEDHSAVFSPVLRQLAEKDPSGCVTLINSIQESHEALLLALQQTEDAKTLAELGHKLKGGAAIINAPELMLLGRQLERHRENAHDVSALLEAIKQEVERVNTQLMAFIEEHVKINRTS